MEAKETLEYLPLEKIIPNPQQPRRRFKVESLEQLAQSIRTQGIIQPLIVRPSRQHAECYELIAGERRWRALQLTNLKAIPVVIREISDADLLEVALLENIQREQLTPIEEGACYRTLLQQHGYTQEELARRLGKDRSTIANFIRLLQLPSAIQNDLEEGRLTVGHARALLALPSTEEQQHGRELILKKSWSVRATEQYVKETLAALEIQTPGTPSRRSSSASLDVQLMTLETELQRHFGTKVSIAYRKGQGHIRLDYYSLEDFDRLYERLRMS